MVDLACERGTCVFVCENEQARPCLVWLLLKIVVPLPGLPRPPHWPPLCSLNKLLNTWPLHVLSLSQKLPSPTHIQTPTYTYVYTILLLPISALTLTALPQRSDRAGFQNKAGPFSKCIIRYTTRGLNEGSKKLKMGKEKKSPE